MRKKIAILMAGILSALTLGVGCGKAAVENIAVKKTEAVPREETAAPGQEEEERETGAGENAVGQEEKERKTVFQEEPGETERQKALRERLGAPEHDQMEFEDAQGVSYKIDGKVTVPDADRLVTMPARRLTFGDEEIAQYVKPLLGEGGLYRWEPEEYQECLEHVANWENQIEQEEDESMREVWEELLQWNEERLEALKGEATKVEVPLTMTSYNKMDSGVYYDYLFGLTDWGEETMHLQAAKYGFGLYAWPTLGEQSCTISEEEAQAAAEECVERMGLSGELVLESVERPAVSHGERYEDGGAFYEFHYMRPVCGVPVGYRSAGMGGAGLDVMVDDGGVTEVRYGDYVLEGNEEEAELLPYSEIRRICEEEWRALGSNLPECVSCRVDEIRLTYYWDEGATEDMIPVWTFSGTFRCSSEEGGEMEGRDILLTINAIDGTVISRF